MNAKLLSEVHARSFNDLRVLDPTLFYDLHCSLAAISPALTMFFRSFLFTGRRQDSTRTTGEQAGNETICFF